MRNKLLCSIFILRLSLAEVRYEQDFCQILDINFFRYHRLFALPAKVKRRAALALLPMYECS